MVRSTRNPRKPLRCCVRRSLVSLDTWGRDARRLRHWTFGKERFTGNLAKVFEVPASEAERNLDHVLGRIAKGLGGVVAA